MQKKAKNKATHIARKKDPPLARKLPSELKKRIERPWGVPIEEQMESPYAPREYKYPGLFNFAKVDFQHRYFIYRMYRERKSPSAIADYFGWHEGAFTEHWREIITSIMHEFEGTIPGCVKDQLKPVKFNERELNLIKMAVIAGRQHDEVAKLLDVNPDILWKYRKENPLVDVYMKSGYEEELLKVEAAIQARARGMVIKETKLASYMGRFTAEKEINVRHLPDPRSAELILVNKRNWKSANITPTSTSSDKGKILKFIEEASSEQSSESQTT